MIYYSIRGDDNMKYFVLSDIHGCVTYLEKALEIFDNSDCDRLMLLGDLLYHGPRNPLIDEYNPVKVITLLNKYSDKIIAVRGNCDSEVDQMVLNFPMMSDYTQIVLENTSIFATHGHLFDENNLPNLKKGDVFINGHYHVPVAKEINGVYLLNPGSITLPKEDSRRSFGILTSKYFRIYDLENEIVNEIDFK